jgi:hypothetical protein
LALAREAEAEERLAAERARAAAEAADEFGPTVLAPGQIAPHVPAPANMKRVRKSDDGGIGPQKDASGRESWMTELPPDAQLSAAAAMTNRTFLPRGKEVRTDKELAAWTDTPADRQRKAAEARAAAEHRSMQLRLTGRADHPPPSVAASSSDKRSSSGSGSQSGSAISATGASSSSTSVSSTSAVSAAKQQSLVEIHAARVAEEKRAARALTDPRFAHFNAALLAPEFDREKDFQVRSVCARDCCCMILLCERLQQISVDFFCRFNFNLLVSRLALGSLISHSLFMCCTRHCFDPFSRDTSDAESRRCAEKDGAARQSGGGAVESLRLLGRRPKQVHVMHDNNILNQLTNSNRLSVQY